MPIYRFEQSGITPLEETTFSLVGLRERWDLQRLLRDHIDVIAPETLVISEEFGDWQDSRRRIDLLGIDKEANLVVIELKRTEDGGHMDLQSIRYASMVSLMTFERAEEVFWQYLKQMNKEDQDPRASILDFLGWNEPDDDQFAQDVRIILASAEFSKELTSSVLWLINHGIDIRCVRLKPYSFDGRLLVDVQQIIPLPEAKDYEVRFRDKTQKERQARAGGIDLTKFDVQIEDEQHKSMGKGRAIFLICKRLCEKGIHPDEIVSLLDCVSNRVWYSVDGVVDVSEFQERAASSGGPRFDRRRWFCGPGELIPVNGKTYAFSTQWGGKSWHRAMSLLKEKYARFKIDFSEVS